MKLSSVRFKISVLYTAVLGVILLVYSLLLYFNLSYVVYHEIDKNLHKKAEEIGTIINAYSERFEPQQEHTPISLKRTIHLEKTESEEFLQWPSIKRLDQEWKAKTQTLGIKQDYIAIYYPGGGMVERSGNMDETSLVLLEKIFTAVPHDKTTIRNTFSKNLHLRVIVQPFYRWGRIRYVIVLGTSLEPVLFILKSKLILIFISIPVFLVFTSFLGRFFVIRAFQPVAEITRTAHAITSRDMTKRVELTHADEEIKNLVDGFNEMIARLERTFKYIEDFSSNVAHELKTPLAIMRGEMELTLRKKRSLEEYQKAMVISLEEAQRMLKTIEDLLLLAKLDYRPEIFKTEVFDLNDFLDEVYEQSQILAEPKKISLAITRCDQPLSIRANRLHLRRLFFNLIDNALKFTPSGGRIDIGVRKVGSYVSVSITDTGAGIAEEDLPRIFDRFYRSDLPTEIPVAGAGLGLSIVQSIAKIHGGGVDVKSVPLQGTTFTVKLPLV